MTEYNILFVCTGNTCRSPMAEAIARHEITTRGWSHVSVGSAGIMAGTNVPAAPNAVRIAEEHGLHLQGHASRQLTGEMIESADLILVMSPTHLEAVHAIGGAENAAMLTSFHKERDAHPIADPFGGSTEEYRTAFQELTEAIDAALNHLEPDLAP